jgi:predicted PurR-regulated permease PerM
VVDRVRSAVTSENLIAAAGGLFGGFQIVFGAVFSALTVFVLTIYFMANFERMRRGAYRLVPASRRERVQALGDEILAKVGAYLVGVLFLAALAGTTSLIFLLIVGVAYPFALAVVVAVCDLIPQVGATIGAVVVTLIALASESLIIGIATLAFFIVYQQSENYLIYPRVMRRAVKVSPVAILVAALLGAVLFGLVGALMAIPAVAANHLIGREVFLPRQDSK